MSAGSRIAAHLLGGTDDDASGASRVVIVSHESQKSEGLGIYLGGSDCLALARIQVRFPALKKKI